MIRKDAEAEKLALNLWTVIIKGFGGKSWVFSLLDCLGSTKKRGIVLVIATKWVQAQGWAAQWGRAAAMMAWGSKRPQVMGWTCLLHSFRNDCAGQDTRNTNSILKKLQRGKKKNRKELLADKWIFNFCLYTMNAAWKMLVYLEGSRFLIEKKR